MLFFKNTTKVNITKSKSNEYKDKDKDSQGKKIIFIVHTNYLAFDKLWCSAMYERAYDYLIFEFVYVESYGK